MITRRGAWWFLGLASIGFGAVVACGDDDVGPAPLKSGSSSGKSGDDDDVAAAPPTEKSACEAYLDAYCAQYDKCSTTPNAGKRCLEYKAACPEYYFLPGSTRTIDNMVQCAKDIAAMNCDQWRAGYRPDCQTDGTLEGDAACVSSAQCKSTICIDSTSGHCGHCLKPSTPDGPCDVAGAEQICPRNYACLKNVCKAIDVNPIAAGMPCNITGAVCGEGLVCYASGTDSVERCQPSSLCSPACDSATSYCIASDDGGHQCVPFKNVGDACSHTDFTCRSDSSYCKVTSGENGTCTANPKAGEPCGQLFGTLVMCDGILACAITDVTTNTGVCVVSGGRGAPCDAAKPCINVLACKNGTCQAPDPSCPADAGP